MGGNEPAIAAVERWSEVDQAWTSLPDMVTARGGSDGRVSFGAAALGGTLVCAVGGYDNSYTALDACECLDLTTNQWEAVAPLAAPRVFHAAVSVGGDTMCVVGGLDATESNALTTVECLDSASMQWTTQTAPTTAERWGFRFGFAAAAVDYTIYAVGGEGYPTASLSMVSLDLDDPSAVWVQRPAMPTPRYLLAVASAGAKLYTVGGYCSQSYEPFNMLEIFDTLTDSWSTGSPMPTGRVTLAAAIVGNTLLAMGGEVPRRGPDLDLDTVDAYDIEASSWSTGVPMTTARITFAAVAIP